jgi:hypothetical protein
MSKKFTICVPYEADFKHDKDVETTMIRCHANYVNDLLKLHGTISLNEVLRSSYFTTRNRYSYRWGWDLQKGHHIDIKIINNPTDLKMVYLKLTAYDIVG